MKTHVGRLVNFLKEPLTFIKWWQYQKTRSSKDNVFLVTMNHAGTHWIRMLVAKSLIQVYGLGDDINDIKAFDLIPPYHRKRYRFKYNDNKRIMRIQHSHAKYYNIHFRNGRVILLVRDLRDAIYSHYRSYSARNAPDLKFSDFLRGHNVDKNRHYTLDRRIDFLNSWNLGQENLKSFLVVRYEDVSVKPNRELGRMFKFLEWDPDETVIDNAVNFASRENMRELEAMNPVSLNEGKTVKVREAKSRQYHDKYGLQDRAYFMRMINSKLRYDYGYNYDIWEN